MRMTDAFGTRVLSQASQAEWAISPDEANDNRLGSLAETPEGRFIVEQYRDCKHFMRKGNVQDFDSAANHAVTAIDEWRAEYP